MLSERQRADLKRKVAASRVPLRDVAYRITAKSIVAFCPACAKLSPPLIRCKSGATKALALEALDQHLAERHGLHLDRRHPVEAAGPAPWVEQAFA
jgi:hypothetical protein